MYYKIPVCGISHQGNGGQTVGGSFGPTGATHIIPGASQVGGSGQSILFVAAGQPVSIGKQREGVGQLLGPMGPGHTVIPSGQLTGQCIMQLPAFSGIQRSGPI